MPTRSLRRSAVDRFNALSGKRVSLFTDQVRIVLLISCCLVSSFASSSGHSKESFESRYNYPGGIAELRLEKLSDELPEIKYGIREPVVIEHEHYWRVLIGIDLETLPGDYLVYLKRATEDARSEALSFNVQQYRYPLHSNSGVSIKRAHKKHKTLSSIDFSNTQQPALPLRLPADGQWTQSFGHIVIDGKNNQAASQNLVSLTTTELLTVNAPQNAIVTKIETRKNGLSTVFLDHGRGLYSILDGVADLSVETGNGVVAGAVLGKLPSSERSNNVIKRLTWQCILNGAYVNPLILTQPQT